MSVSALASVVRAAAASLQGSAHAIASSVTTDEDDDDDASSSVAWAMRVVSSVLQRRLTASKQLVALIVTVIRLALAAAVGVRQRYAQASCARALR
jgi:hypothetical protein